MNFADRAGNNDSVVNSFDTLHLTERFLGKLLQIKAWQASIEFQPVACAFDVNKRTSSLKVRMKIQ
jgi:hypothetical protein